jgi:hypothetical protein
VLTFYFVSTTAETKSVLEELEFGGKFAQTL